jgi:hypothetical protein
MEHATDQLVLKPLQHHMLSFAQMDKYCARPGGPMWVIPSQQNLCKYPQGKGVVKRIGASSIQYVPKN